MPKFELWYPVSPLHINQAFGGNAAYYARFTDNYGQPIKGHQGLDLQAAHGQPVYAAHDGLAWYVGPDDHGGDGIYIRTAQPDADGKYWTTIYWHLCSKDDTQFKPLVNALTPVKRGDLIGYADNSGAPFESTGDHLHWGLAECDQNGVFIHKQNGYGGCQDPLPFCNGKYATDIAQPPTPAVNVAVIAAQKVEQGNLSLANMLYAVVGVIRAYWNQK